MQKLRSPHVRMSTWLCIAATTVLISLWLAAVVRANLDLSAGRFALYMDEGLVFDGIERILHPESLRTFFYAVTDGGDQRYGRILWNLTALTGFLPDRIWGQQGLIVAERVTQALLLLLAAILLTMTHLRRWSFRLLLLLLLLVVPYAAYYATMPKPEPLELAFIAAFLWAHGRRGYGLGVHWLLLGLAFGAKIAVLPLVLVLALDSIWRETDSGTLSFKRVGQTMVSFGLGLGLAVPTLLLPIGIAVAILLLLQSLLPLSNWIAQIALFLAALCAGSYFGRHKINDWLDWTFRNTSHPSDQASINAYSWVRYLFENWMIGPLPINLLVAISVGALFLLAILSNWDVKQFTRPLARPLILVVGGLAMLAAIFVSSHRLWGFYLMPGMFLLLTGAVALSEQSIPVGTAPSASDRVRQLFAFASCAAMAILAVCWWAPEHARTLDSLSRRTDDPVYRQQYTAYKDMIAAGTSYARSRGRQISMVVDPSLFLPMDTPWYKVSVFWGPYKSWTEPVDMLVLGASHLPGGPGVRKDSADYPAYLIEQAGYARHVARGASSCELSPCYRRVVRLPDGGEILGRQDGPASHQ